MVEIQLKKQYMKTSGATRSCTTDAEFFEPFSYTPLNSDQWSSAIDQNYYPNIYGPGFGINNASTCHLEISRWPQLPGSYPHVPGPAGLTQADGLIVTVTVISKVDPPVTSFESGPKVLATSTADRTSAVLTLPQALLPSYFAPPPTPVITAKPVSIAPGSAAKGGYSETEAYGDPRHPVTTNAIMAQKSVYSLPPSDHSIGAQSLHLESVIEPSGTRASTTSAALTLIVGTQTLVPGGPAIAISGTPVSLDLHATALVIGSSTLPVHLVPSFSTLAGSTMIVSPAGTVVIGTQTLVPGGPAITISNAPISLAAETVGLQAAASGPPGVPPPVLMFAGSVYTESPTVGFVIGAQTVAPGGLVVTVDGTPVSLAPGATEIVIGSQTLVPGGPAVTVDGTPVSLAPGASGLPGFPPPVLTFAGSVYTESPTIGFIIGSQTLVPGGPVITVDDTPVSLAPGATETVVESVTEVFQSTQAIGGMTMSGSAGENSVAEVTAVATTDTEPTGSMSPTGGAEGSRIRGCRWIVVEALVLASAMVVISSL